MANNHLGKSHDDSLDSVFNARGSLSPLKMGDLSHELNRSGNNDSFHLEHVAVESNFYDWNDENAHILNESAEVQLNTSASRDYPNSASPWMMQGDLNRSQMCSPPAVPNENGNALPNGKAETPRRKVTDENPAVPMARRNSARIGLREQKQVNTYDFSEGTDDDDDDDDDDVSHIIISGQHSQELKLKNGKSPRRPRASTKKTEGRGSQASTPTKTKEKKATKERKLRVSKESKKKPSLYGEDGVFLSTHSTSSASVDAVGGVVRSFDVLSGESLFYLDPSPPLEICTLTHTSSLLLPKGYRIDLRELALNIPLGGEEIGDVVGARFAPPTGEPVERGTAGFIRRAGKKDFGNQLQLRLKTNGESRVQVKVFSTGALATTGAKTERDAMQAVETVVGGVRLAGIPVQGHGPIELRNALCTGFVGVPNSLWDVDVIFEYATQEKEPGVVAHRIKARGRAAILEIGSPEEDGHHAPRCIIHASGAVQVMGKVTPSVAEEVYIAVRKTLEKMVAKRPGVLRRKLPPPQKVPRKSKLALAKNAGVALAAKAEGILATSIFASAGRVGQCELKAVSPTSSPSTLTMTPPTPPSACQYNKLALTLSPLSDQIEEVVLAPDVDPSENLSGKRRKRSVGSMPRRVGGGNPDADTSP